MKPNDLKTKIFLDGGDPNETKGIIKLLGFLDGQTTNPTLIAGNPTVKNFLNGNNKFSLNSLYAFYRSMAKEISEAIPKGSISLEVYADKKTSAEAIIKEAEEMFSWIPNAHIKLPITREGLKAAAYLSTAKIRINMTLCFSQEQAAAVYAATKGAFKGQIFISPFVGRLDDRNENGMDLIKNIIQMYGQSDGHVEVLTASVRNLDHFLYAIQLGSNIITSPSKILKEWMEKGMPLPGADYSYNRENFKSILYKNFDLEKYWQEFEINHPLTEAGIERFSNDWNKLII